MNVAKKQCARTSSIKRDALRCDTPPASRGEDADPPIRLLRPRLRFCADEGAERLIGHREGSQSEKLVPRHPHLDAKWTAAGKR
jgi:hypothetical protein